MPMPVPASATGARYVPVVPAPEQRRRRDDDDGDGEEGWYYYTAHAGYVPLRGPGRSTTTRRGHGEYAARRALFLQSYRFSTSAGGGLRERVARRMRDAAARAVSRARGAARWWVGVGVARAWRLGWWRQRALGCFGGGAHGRKLHYMYDFA